MKNDENIWSIMKSNQKLRLATTTMKCWFSDEFIDDSVFSAIICCRKLYIFLSISIMDAFFLWIIFCQYLLFSPIPHHYFICFVCIDGFFRLVKAHKRKKIENHYQYWHISQLQRRNFPKLREIKCFFFLYVLCIYYYNGYPLYLKKKNLIWCQNVKHITNESRTTHHNYIVKHKNDDAIMSSVLVLILMLKR